MKTFTGLFSLASVVVTPALLSSCTEADMDHFYGRDVQPGYNGPSTYQGQYQAPATDSFYEQQNAAREANLKAGRELQYKGEMQSYENGYRSTLPNY
jgi:hypothetical protein